MLASYVASSVDPSAGQVLLQSWQASLLPARRFEDLPVLSLDCKCQVVQNAGFAIPVDTVSAHTAPSAKDPVASAPTYGMKQYVLEVEHDQTKHKKKLQGTLEHAHD